MISALMSGVLLAGHGGPKVLAWSEAIPVPRPVPGEVLVRVLAAGANNTDIATRAGWYGVGAEAGHAGALRFPRIQGGDLCGRVAAWGDGGAGLAVSARVTCPINQADGTARGYVALGSDYDGAFAQYVVVPGRHLFDVSASPLTDIEIAAMPCAFGTALNLLTRAGVGDGQWVLVTGASGGVGLAELRPGGVCAVAGAIAGPVVETDLRRVYLDDLTIFGFTHQPPEVFARLVGFINWGQLRPLISCTHPLRDIATAQADFLTERFPGKLVLIPPETHP